jgi:hypothetical protein
MGYSRAGSQSLLRASRTWTLEGFADAGSTGLPSFGLLRNRGRQFFTRWRNSFVDQAAALSGW